MDRLAKILVPALVLVLLALHPLGADTAACAPAVQGTAPWYCSQINQALANYWEQWEPVAFIAVFISFGIASVIFGMGVLLRSERIRNFGIGEYYEAAASAIIVIGFVFIASVMFGLIPGIATGPVNPYNVALTYISNTITQLNAEISQLFNIAALDGFWLNVKFYFCPPLVPNPLLGITGYPPPNANDCAVVPQLFYYAIYGAFYIPALVMIDLQLEVIGVLYAEFWIILTFMYIAIPVFLIPGVILRSLIPTRGLGGMMIAVAIGFYMVLPLLFSVAYYFTNTQTIQCTGEATTALTQYGLGTGAQTNALTATSPLEQTLGNIQVCMDSYWLSVLFYPALIMALTYAIILQVAEFIGGMAQLSGRIRL
ncbi:MAG TPA: hypothetical protein VL945_00490 [Candidatus Saccharimonadales bacterium]|nr:hypothetical protein [Candidatus Saccharimonadales bacterium]